MTKKIVIAAVIVVAGLWLVKKTQVCSYASMLVARGQETVRQQIPRDFQLARAKNEIQRLDRDYQGLLGPIAERKAAVKKLEREINNTTSKLQEQREALVALTKAIDAKEAQIVYNGATYSLERAKTKLQREFATFKKMESQLATKEKLLEAQQKNLVATLDQLDKLVTQKRQLEVRLAELEAEEETLAAARIQSPVATDDGRVAEIKRILDDIEHRQSVETQLHQLQQTYGSKIGDATPSVEGPAANFTEIRDYLEGKTTPSGAKVAQGK
jgi:chromosome segregation ATPase